MLFIVSGVNLFSFKDIFYSELLHELQKIMKTLTRSSVNQVVDTKFITKVVHDENIIAPADALLNMKVIIGASACFILELLKFTKRVN